MIRWLILGLIAIGVLGDIALASRGVACIVTGHAIIFETPSCGF